jgi:FkbM family methyltransferase
MNWRKLADEALARLEQPSDLASRFMNTSADALRYAIGKNGDTERLNSLVPLAGVIDDFAAGTPSWRGIPLVPTNAVPKDAIIANCSTSISPVAVLKHLADQGLDHVVGLHQLIAAAAGRLPWPWFTSSMRRELCEHADAWARMHDSLADEISQRTFLDVVRFRLTCDPNYMSNYAVRIQEQYFEDFMQFHDEVFVDAGGFDGDTSEGFARRYPDYRKIILFEPSRKNMEAARKRLSEYRDIDYRPLGLSDTAGTLHFNENAGSASAIAVSAATEIRVDTLDAAVIEPVSFIKMDLEGWELKALHGASHHIAHDRPKLAIAAYHDSPDFRLIYSFINGFAHNYRCYWRCYTQEWSETIMFFV